VLLDERFQAAKLYRDATAGQQAEIQKSSATLGTGSN
jgi:hypothetical protein